MQNADLTKELSALKMSYGFTVHE